MLDDFNDANGGTRLVPGSHLDPGRTDYALEDTVAAEGPAGSALVFDGRLTHGTGANVTEAQERVAVLTYHCRPFVRQQENYLLGLDPELRRNERGIFLRRLGFWIWAGLGRTHDPGERGALEPLVTTIGPLDAEGRPLVETHDRELN
jgi:ectoine hydroxylase-related dioxygenase (phytanoyl-CoA dioxygenase family)